MFAVGDTVIYGSVGVCKISDITENKLTGVVRKYYVLKQIDTYESVIYVPVDNEKLTSRMRCVPTDKELKKILKDAKKCELSWIDDNLSRNDAFHSILNDGEITQVIKLFRVLHFKKSKLSGNGKHLHKADEKIYKECAKLLSCELSSILKTDNSDILSLVVED